MIKINEKLTILHDDNSVFADYSDVLADFTRGTASFTFISAEDSIYVGFEKPINTFYVEMSTANSNDVTMTVKYYNGSTFAAVTNLFDDTDGLQRSGFVSWKRKIDDSNWDEALTTINSVEQYWYKVDLSGDSSAMVIKGINIVFSDDQDLKRELFEISNYLPSGESTHILSHVAARDEIIQTINLKGREKKDVDTGYLQDITAFDLLDVSEVKLASTYLTLSKIMFAASDTVDDVFFIKHQAYRSMYKNIIDMMDLSVDSDNDGKRDQAERFKFGYGFVTRL